jgi:hypothetical protein
MMDFIDDIFLDKSLQKKILTKGSYWPTLFKNVYDYYKKYEVWDVSSLCKQIIG